MASIATLKYIPRETLAKLIKSPSPSVAVIDVRDNDYIGGHILGCQNVPVHTHDHAIPELVRSLADKETVIFHCALSQQRGPKSALRYLRERERMLGSSSSSSSSAGDSKRQQVFVLEGGFVKWQEM